MAYWLQHPESDCIFFSETFEEYHFFEWVCEISNKAKEDSIKDLVRCLHLEWLKNYSNYTQFYNKSN